MRVTTERAERIAFTQRRPQLDQRTESGSRYFDRRFWVIVLSFSVAVRVAVAFYYGSSVPTLQDDYSYSQLAWRLATGHGYSFDRAWYPFTPQDTPTAHWSFLYTALVAGVYRVVGYQPLLVRLFSGFVTGILLPLVIFGLTRRVFPAHPVIAFWAAAVGAGYAYFILFAARILTEGLYMIALLWSLDRALVVSHDLHSSRSVPLQHSLQLGLSLGLATLLRQVILPWIPVLLGWLMLQLLTAHEFRATRLRVTRDVLRGSRSLVLAGLTFVACIVPWTVRNHAVYGEFLLLNSSAGYAMYSAQHPVHGTRFQEHAAAPLPEELRDEKALTEPAWDRALMERGIGFVLTDPVRYLKLSASRILDFFEFWPTRDSPLMHNIGRLVSFTMLLPLMVYGSVLSLKQSLAQARNLVDLAQDPSVLVLGFYAFYTLLHVLTWAMPRYRVPLDAVIMPYAALGISDLYRRLQGRMGWLPRSGHPLHESN